MCWSYRHELPEPPVIPLAAVVLSSPHMSSGHRGQQSPGPSGRGLSQVSGGHSSFQQSNSPYCVEVRNHVKSHRLMLIARNNLPDIRTSDTGKSTALRCGTSHASAPGADRTLWDRTADSTGHVRCPSARSNSCTVVPRS